jgi:hypothetical protein
MTKSVIPRCEPDTHVVYLAIMNEVMMTQILCKYDHMVLRSCHYHKLSYELNNSMEHSPPSEAISGLGSYDLPCLLCKLRVHCSVGNSCPVRNHMNPIPSLGVCVTFCNMGVFYGNDFSVAVLKYLTGEPSVFGCLFIVCLVYSQLHSIYGAISSGHHLLMCCAVVTWDACNMKKEGNF